MKTKKISKVFLIALTVLVMAGCVAGCAFLFSKAYDIGVQSALSSRASAPRSVSSASSPKSSAPKSVSSASTVHVAASALEERDLVLVNSTNRIPVWYAPNITDAYGLKMDSSVVEPFAAMRTDASRDGVSLWISSAYRSNELQNELFQKEVETYSKTCPTYSEAMEAAAHSVAKPGYSEHATGLALDLNGVREDFDQTAAFRWLNLHAQDYGFVLRYPKDKQNVTGIKYEPWHYRYVGVENAKAMKKSGLCLEEYCSQKQSG